MNLADLTNLLLSRDKKLWYFHTYRSLRSLKDLLKEMTPKDQEIILSQLTGRKKK